VKVTPSVQKKYISLAAILLMGTALLSGCSKPAPKPAAAIIVTPVNITTVKIASISETIPVTGNLVALQDVQLSAKEVGRISAVYGREGDTVHAGQLIVQQDTTDLIANVNQAEANVLSAQSSLSQAVTNYQIQVTNAKQGVLMAQAQVEGAQQAYNKEVNGSRPQEVLEGKSSLLSAQATRDNDLITLNRNKELYAQGAIAKADLDTAQTNYDVSVQQYQNTKASFDLTVIGNRQEDIASALATLNQQKTNLINAIAAVKQVSVKRDAITAAQASIAQYQAALAFSKVQLDNASIVSPINGIIATRSTEPGQIANPGTSLMRIVNLHTMTFQPSISETDIAKIKQGTEVDTTADALPSQVFKGYVTAIYPAADDTDRGFTVRVALDNPNGLLKPGMFARGNVVTGTHRNVPVVPVDVLVADSTQAGYTPNTSSNQPITAGTLIPPQYVVIAKPDDTALIQPVKIGYVNSNFAEITGGLSAGQHIIEVGQTTLKTGDKISIQNDGSQQQDSLNNTPTQAAG